jgi:flavin reductase (DIM6/NTAB) family NADH-FMN oxidoreductase RutF
MNVYHYNHRVNESVFKDAMSLIPTNVAIIGSLEKGAIRACTISSLVSLDVVDPKIVFVLKNYSATLVNIKSALAFSVNVLGSNQSKLSAIYSNSEREIEILNNSKSWSMHESGVPMINNSHLNFVCKFESALELNNSTLVFAKVLSVLKLDSKSPLIYFNRDYYELMRPDLTAH